jgi:hypothetical protein
VQRTIKACSRDEIRGICPEPLPLHRYHAIVDAVEAVASQRGSEHDPPLVPAAGPIFTKPVGRKVAPPIAALD